ncbi:MAG: hypothetical protein AB9903_31190 [Vulcanimicrobiota bacterium]
MDSIGEKQIITGIIAACFIGLVIFIGYFFLSSVKSLQAEQKSLEKAKNSLRNVYYNRIKPQNSDSDARNARKDAIREQERIRMNQSKTESGGVRLSVPAVPAETGSTGKQTRQGDTLQEETIEPPKNPTPGVLDS